MRIYQFNGHCEQRTNATATVKKQGNPASNNRTKLSIIKKLDNKRCSSEENWSNQRGEDRGEEMK